MTWRNWNPTFATGSYATTAGPPELRETRYQEALDEP